MEKRRITVNIAGSPITFVTDESEDFATSLAATVDERVRELTKNSFRVSSLDAALLLAVDYLGDKRKSDEKILALEQKIRSLEAQLSLYEVKLASYESQADADDSGEQSENPPASPAENSETIGSAIKDCTTNANSESTIRALERYLESKKNDTGAGSTNPRQSREEKIRYIESLLRGE